MTTSVKERPQWPDTVATVLVSVFVLGMWIKSKGSNVERTRDGPR